MQYTGGIYIDIDTYMYVFFSSPSSYRFPLSNADGDVGRRLRSLDDLLYHPMTLGMEASPDSRRGELDPTGLCVSFKRFHTIFSI